MGKNSRLQWNVHTFGHIIVRTSLRAFFNDGSSLISPATGFAHEIRTTKSTFHLSLRKAWKITVEVDQIIWILYVAFVESNTRTSTYNPKASRAACLSFTSALTLVFFTINDNITICMR